MKTEKDERSHCEGESQLSDKPAEDIIVSLAWKWLPVRGKEERSQ